MVVSRGPEGGQLPAKPIPASGIRRTVNRYKAWPLWAKISAPAVAVLLLGALVPNENANSAAGDASVPVAAATTRAPDAATTTPAATTIASTTTAATTT